MNMIDQATAIVKLFTSYLLHRRSLVSISDWQLCLNELNAIKIKLEAMLDEINQLIAELGYFAE